MISRRRWLFITGLVICAAGLYACSPDNDEAASNDDDVKADGDATDDDAIDDDAIDDDAIDDDAIDDDADDVDDDIDDPSLTRLMVIGTTTDDTTTSWIQTNQGWRRWDIPPPARPLGAFDEARLGPVVALDETHALAVWNTLSFTPIDAWSEWITTVDHEWLAFERGVGWSLAATWQRTAPGRNVSHLKRDAQGTIWVVAHYGVGYANLGIGTSWFLPFTSLYRYQAGVPTSVRYVGLGEVTDLEFTSDGHGWAGAGTYIPPSIEWWTYSGGSWSSQTVPAWLQLMPLYSLLPEDENRGWVTALDQPFGVQLFRIDGTGVTIVPKPATCGPYYSASRLAGYPEHIVALNPDTLDEEVMEYSGGEWRCRDLSMFGDVTTDVAAVLTDGRAFVLLKYAEAPMTERIVELSDAAVTEIDPPPDADRLTALLAIGPDAPLQAGVE